MATQSSSEAFSASQQQMTQASNKKSDSIGQVTKRDGRRVPFDVKKLMSALERAAVGLLEVSLETVLFEVKKMIFDGIETRQLEQAVVLAASSFIERDPAYNTLSSRLYLQLIYKHVLGVSTTVQDRDQRYREIFIAHIKRGVERGQFDKRLLNFDLERVASAICPERDHLLGYVGIHTLYTRYFLKEDGRIFETPQAFWMRVAMGLALNEMQPEDQAIKFYTLLSSLRYISSTPTLFHAGLKRAQLSSCYLSTVHDDLGHIFKVMGDNAQLSKWAGGIGNDWTYIRGTGSVIKGINATSQGVVPFLKIANDVVSGITKSGIRRGGTTAYLETWHLDIEDFLDLRRNTGDERRRTHDMNTANWIPDLFLKRVQADEEWTLFSPDEVPDLHDLYGRAFEQRYLTYEELSREGKIKMYKVISAKALWRKMLSRLFETGHPWITFKDPCNVRSPQDHVGVVHCSNLCTEITLNTSADETAVCNLGSINLEKHVSKAGIDEALVAQTVKTAIRMLDNVIDLNFYPTAEARNSNLRHRPIGLGMMGFQDALFKQDLPFDDPRALEFADKIAEMVSYYGILASSELAKERGTYPSYFGSKWHRDVFPIDTVDVLEQERGVPIEVSRTSHMNWQPVRDHVKSYGMRNSNVTSIAPTATIANIAGCYPTIEPIYKNIYVKSNISGEFTIVNTYLVRELKALGMWDQQMLDKLKYYDGDISLIDEIPDRLQKKYRGAFELDQIWLLKMTAARGKWICQSQSHNVFMKGVSGKMLDDIYMSAWKFGLKTTYYLRTLGASQIEKSTLDAKKFGYTQRREYKKIDGSEESIPATQVRSCGIDDEECEACQ